MEAEWSTWITAALTGVGALMTLVMSVIGWFAKQSFGKLDKHMERVEQFMAESSRSEAVMRTELRHHDEKFAGQERWIQSIEARVNDSRMIGQIHAMTSEMHERGCGVQQELDRR